jgi:ribosomal protein S18 acetylase RimI-like enzyme
MMRLMLRRNLTAISCPMITLQGHARAMLTARVFLVRRGGQMPKAKLRNESSADANVESLALVRTARIADAQVISAVLRAAFTPFVALYTRAGFEATVVQPIEVEARMGEGPVWVAEIGGEVVGTVSAVLRHPALYVRGMAVIPAIQRCGIGDRLLRQVEHFGRENGVARLELTTTPFLVAALQLYERHGFRRVRGKKDLHGTPLIGMEKALTAAL